MSEKYISRGASGYWYVKEVGGGYSTIQGPYTYRWFAWIVKLFT